MGGDEDARSLTGEGGARVSTAFTGEVREKIGRAVQKVAGKLGIEASEERLDRTVLYIEELMRWNRAFNLVGRRLDLDGILLLFLDSLTPLSIKGIVEEGAEVLDIGSGAGMPGLPLLIFGGPFSLTMVESQRKKVTFIRYVCHRLGLSSAGVYPGRLEDMRREEDYISAFDLGLARAVMEPVKLLKGAAPLISEEGRAVLFVGKGDAERLRRGSAELERMGWKLDSLRCTQRYVGRENYLAVFRKARPREARR